MSNVLKKRFFTGLMALSMVISQIIMPASSAYATHSGGEEHGPDPKVFVCKYVGTPGVDERLKEGKNPISVSSNATVGTYFSDAQGRSYVLAEDNTAPGPEGDPDVSECPAPEVGPEQIATPSIVTSENCGPNNDTYTVPANPLYTVVDNMNGTFTLTANDGYVFSTTLKNTVTITVPADENTACPTPTVCTDMPIVHSTNFSQDGWNIPADAEYVEGGIELNVSGNWDSTYISRAMVGPLADIGSVVDFEATPEQYVGIHIVTDKGTLTFEKEDSYGNNWWSWSDFDVAEGMGYPTFDTLENIVAANPGVMTSELRVLYTHPEASSTIITSVTVGCVTYTFDKEVVQVTECPAENLPIIRATNANANGWTVPASAEYLAADGGIKLTVPGEWVSSYISRDMVGPLADIGSVVSFDATPEQYVGIHIVTDKGTLTYEYGPGYDNKWWSDDNFGVASGMGYATFDTLENIVAANPGLMTAKLYVLYTHPEASSSVVKSVTVGCVEYVFSKVGGSGGNTPEVPTVPTTPVAPTTPATPAAGGQGSVMPAELPLTGSNGSIVSTWAALLAAVLTYGAVYYLQPKKRFES